ncbi:hypothetical protein AKJ08_0373 [Vulgatibacter incomptus]|uniref:Protein BatD n=1 Tax=Vulgatibacter incomptus TaxID=1391653 RepID=A0A0K1P991_9BACT|nr:hypothetical protein AKJ08_0373 [Vulgatibacter incomptus]
MAQLAMALLVALAASTARAEASTEQPEAVPLGLTAKAEPSRVALGRPFVYEIEIRHEPSDRYELPKPLTLGNASVRKAETEASEEGGVAITRFRIEASIFDSLGDAALPDIVLQVRSKDGAKVLRVPGAPVTIVGSTEETELAGSRPPQEVRVPSYTLVWIGLGAGVAIALAVAVWRRLARTKAGGETLPRQSAEERALAALRDLEGLGLASAGKGREHYFRLSEVMRSYLLEAAGIAAPDMTSEELRAALEKQHVPGLAVPAFELWLGRADLARYAGATVMAEDAAADLGHAREMVQAVAAAIREVERSAEGAEAAIGGDPR